MSNPSTKNAGKSLSRDDCDEICRLYEAGVPARDIVEKFGIHRTTLPKVYKRTRGINRSLIPRINNPRYFQVIDTHEKAYFLGFIAADGCIVDHSNTGGKDAFAINIHERDRCILEAMRVALQLEHPLYEIKAKNQVAIRVTCQELCDDLKQYGLGYRKSLTMGNIFPLIPEEFRDSFALGYNDGDGCIYIKTSKYFTKKRGVEKIYSYPAFGICGTKEFLLGFAEHFNLSNISIVNHRSIQGLHINSRDDFWKVYHRLYANAPICLARKRDVVNSFLQDQTISSSAANDNVPTEPGARVPLIA